MNVSLHFAAGAALVVLLSGHAYAGKAGAPAAAQGEGRTLQADQAGSANRAATAPSGSSVVERDKKRYENQKRAADRRAAQLKRANKSGSSVVERDQKRYENQKRAAERRAAEIKKAETAEHMKDAGKQKPAAAQGQAPAAK